MRDGRRPQVKQFIDKARDVDKLEKPKPTKSAPYVPLTRGDAGTSATSKPIGPSEN